MGVFYCEYCDNPSDSEYDCSVFRGKNICGFCIEHLTEDELDELYEEESRAAFEQRQDKAIMASKGH